MPPPAIKTVRDLIYWQYAKIMAGSAIKNKKSWGYIMDRFKKLQQEEIFWNKIREYIKEREKPNECILCGKKTSLTLDHLFPQSLNGPNDEKNVIWICQQCNSSKGTKRLYEYWTIKNNLKAAKYDIPRIAEGKYLKFIYEIFQQNNLLNLSEDDLKQQICPNCDLKKLCIQEKSEYKLSPLCLDGITTIVFKK
jgi:rubrerythrin